MNGLYPIKRRVSRILIWSKVESLLISNLHALSLNGREVGFIDKPIDTATDKNAWRCYLGIGKRARFLGHAWTKDDAQAKVEAAL